MKNKYINLGKFISISVIFIFIVFLCGKSYAYDSLIEDDKYQFYIETSPGGLTGSNLNCFEINERINIKKLLTFAPIDNDYIWNDKTQQWEEVNPKMDIILNKLGVYSSNEDIIAVEIEEGFDGIGNSLTGIYLRCKKVGSAIITADYYYNNKHYIVQAEYSVIEQENSSSSQITESANENKNNTQSSNTNLNNSNNKSGLSNQSNSNIQNGMNTQKNSSPNNDELKGNNAQEENKSIGSNILNNVTQENEDISTNNYNDELVQRTINNDMEESKENIHNLINSENTNNSSKVKNIDKLKSSIVITIIIMIVTTIIIITAIIIIISKKHNINK